MNETSSMPGLFYVARADLHTIVGIDGEFYRLLYVDEGFQHPEDNGLYRAWKVGRDQFGRWVCCDDNDFMIDPVSFRIVAREAGWELRREKI